MKIKKIIGYSLLALLFVVQLISLIKDFGVLATAAGFILTVGIAGLFVWLMKD